MKKVFLVSMSLLVFGLLTSCDLISSSNLEGSTWVIVEKSEEMKMEMKTTLSFKSATEAEVVMDVKMEGEEPMTVSGGQFSYTFDEQQVVLTNKDDASEVITLRREGGKLIGPLDDSGKEQVFKKK